LSCSKPHSFM